MPQGVSPHRPGEALAEAFRKRGIELAPDEAARITRFLLSLAAAGALVANEESASVHQDGGGPGPSGSPGSRPVVRGAAGSAKGPTVYNMGPSIHRSAGDAV